MHERVHTVQLINLMKRENCHHMETTQLIYPANKLTGFYMMATLAFNELTLVANGVTLKTLITINDKLITYPLGSTIQKCYEVAFAPKISHQKQIRNKIVTITFVHTCSK